MNTISSVLENRIQFLASSLVDIEKEAREIILVNSATDAASLVEALGSNSTPATVSTGLTKSQYKNMVGGLIAVNAFFTNQAASQGDYLSNSSNVLNGSSPAANILSNNVESIGERLKAIGSNLLSLYAEATEIVEIYNTSELGTAVEAISGSVIVFGASVTASKFASGIVLLDQFSKLLNNQATIQSDYLSNALGWKNV